MTRRREGYVFPLALAAIIIISLVVTAAATQVERSNRAAAQLTDSITFEGEMHSAEQTILYHMLTEPLGGLGIEIGGQSGLQRLFSREVGDSDITLLRANGTPLSYGEHGTIIRYYDQQAFINLAAMDQASITRLLDMLELPRSRYSQLVATLLDFQDANRLRNPGGAEAGQYDNQQLPPNRRLENPAQICDVVGWRTLEYCDDIGHLLLLASIRSTTQLNVRLASSQFLTLLLDDSERGFAVLERIEEGEVSNFAQLGHPGLDIQIDLASAVSGPGNYFVLVSHDPNVNFAWRSSFLLTPNSADRPFSIRSRYRIGGEYVRSSLKVSTDENIQPLPEAGEESNSDGRRR